MLGSLLARLSGKERRGIREILGVEVAPTKSEITHQDLFRSLKNRKLLGVGLVVSDDHEEFKVAALAASGGQTHQGRCTMRGTF